MCHVHPNGRGQCKNQCLQKTAYVGHPFSSPQFLREAAECAPTDWLDQQVLCLSRCSNIATKIHLEEMAEL
jgi:hypothetical protein